MNDKKHAENLGDLLAKTEEQLKNLECCGNCKHGISFLTNGEKTIVGIECELTGKNMLPDSCCEEEWKYDGRTQEHRRIHKKGI